MLLGGETICYMKVYNKGAFLTGVVCAGALLLFAIDVLHADWWQWLISIAITVRLLYIGLTEEGSRQAKKVEDHYAETAASLHGKHHSLKTNLPWILVIVFYPIALFLRFAFEIYLPIWMHVGFVILLTVAAAYSIGIERSIREYIETNIPEDIQDDFS